MYFGNKIFLYKSFNFLFISIYVYYNYSSNFICFFNYYFISFLQICFIICNCVLCKKFVVF